jgi:hypothetical protein
MLFDLPEHGPDNFSIIPEGMTMRRYRGNAYRNPELSHVQTCLVFQE